MITQRQIVEVPFNLPQGVENHPLIVLSNNDIIENEGCFTGIMLTSRRYDDAYSFIIEDSMLSRPLSRDWCEARLHLVSLFRLDDVIRNRHPGTWLHKLDFEAMVREIVRSSFS